jgi:hypothetical protein
MNAAGMRFIGINSRIVGYFEVEGRPTANQSCQSVENCGFPELLGESGVPAVCQVSTGSLSQNRYFHAFPRALKICDLTPRKP